MVTHSSTLAWRIPWMEEPGGLQSMGLRRVGHDRVASLSRFTFMHWRRKWQPTPVFLPGESRGQRSLGGCCLWGCTESDMTDATQQQQQQIAIQCTLLAPSNLFKSFHWNFPLDATTLPISPALFILLYFFFYPQLFSPSNLLCVHMGSLSCVQLFEAPWTVAPQMPLSMGFFRARILELVAIPFSRGSSPPRDRT